MAKSSFKAWFDLVREALINLLLAPFLAFGVLIAMLIIALGLWIQAGELVLSLIHDDLDLGIGEYVFEFGVDQLPTFFY